MLQKLIDDSTAFDQLKFDCIAPAKNFAFNEQARIVPPAEGGFQIAPLEMNDHSLRQVCAKLGPAVFGKGSAKVLPFDYMTAIPADLRGTVLNRHLTAANGNRWMVRGYGDKARAVLSGDFPGGHDDLGQFENTQYLRIVQTFVEEGMGQFPDMKIVRPNVSADDLNVKLTWKDINQGGNGGGYGVGVAIINGETGARKLKCLPLLQRTVCTNSIIVDDENGFEFIHRGSFAAMRTQFKAAIGKMLGAAGELLDRMIEAENEQIPDFDAVLSGLAVKHNWPQNVRDSVWAGTERETTRAAIVNGVTYAAHTAIQEPNDQVEMEILGGRLLVAPGSLFEQAAKQYRRQNAGID